jgi:hypothetical protein
VTLIEKGTRAAVWTPFREWTRTTKTRRELALHLADLAQVKGMGDTIAAGLAELAGHLTDEERWERFEVLTEALRVRSNAADHEIDRACARVDDAVADLCEVAS